MDVIAGTFRIFAAVFAAVVATILRRLVRGPTVPGWTWEVELKRVAFRAFVMASALPSNQPARRRLEQRLDPRLPADLRGNVEVRPDRIGGRAAERHVRTAGDLTDRALILYLHGGAYVTGSPATHRRFVARLIWETHTSGIVPDYRLAPRHRFPAAVDDAEAAYRDLLDAGTEPGRIVVSGDSAGGGLAVALLLRLRDRDLPQPAGAVLFSPYTDLEHTGSSIRRNYRTDYLPLVEPVRPNFEYLGDADPRHPLASPIWADLTGLAPLLVFAGGREMILDDSVRLVKRARDAGVDVAFHLEGDMYHVWPALLPTHPATVRALAVAAEWVEAVTQKSS